MLTSAARLPPCVALALSCARKSQPASIMRKTISALLVLGVLSATHPVFAQLAQIGGQVINGTYEQGVFGAIANTSCTVTPMGAPAWGWPSMPANLSAGESVTWGYADGLSGSTTCGGQTSDGSLSLTNVSFRNVIRGANQNGGTPSRLWASTVLGGNSSSVHCIVWSSTLNQFGVAGASNIHWEVRATNIVFGTSWVVASGDGEADLSITNAMNTYLECTVAPTSADENGSVLVTWAL